MNKLITSTQSNSQIKPQSNSIQYKSSVKSYQNYPNNRTIKSTEDIEFDKSLAQGKKIIQILQGSFKQITDKKFVFNTSLFIQTQPLPKIKSFNGMDDKTIVVKKNKKTVCNKTREQRYEVDKISTPSLVIVDKNNNTAMEKDTLYSKHVFETLFNYKFFSMKPSSSSTFRKNSSNSNMTTTRENTARAKHGYIRLNSTRNIFRTDQTTKQILMTMKSINKSISKEYNMNPSMYKGPSTPYNNSTPIKQLSKKQFMRNTNCLPNQIMKSHDNYHKKHHSLY